MSEETSGKQQKISEKCDSSSESQNNSIAEIRTKKNELIEVTQDELLYKLLPPLSIVEGYENILPGSTDRILSIAEKQFEHRRKVEESMVKAESRDSLIGIIFAFLIGIGCLITATIMVISVPRSGAAIAGTMLGVTGIGSITSSFIVNTRRHNIKNTQEKKENNDS